MRRWAIAVGVNQYQFFQPLSYAQEDAQALRASLMHKAGFSPEQCLLLTDTSAPIGDKPTCPNRQTIQNWINLLTQHYLQPGDLLWFFFTGYSICWEGQDYLVPIDGNPTNPRETAISFESIFNSLSASPAQTTVVLLDVTHSEKVPRMRKQALKSPYWQTI